MTDRTATGALGTPAAPDAAMHDKVLIVDFGSQVTQLIARRVREAGVYCEIVPFDKAEAAIGSLAPKGRDPVGRPGLHPGRGQPQGDAGDLRPRTCRCSASATASQAMAHALGGTVEGRSSSRVRSCRRPKSRPAAP